MSKADRDLIRRLMDEYLELSESPDNQRRLGLWEPEVCARDQWHGRPRADAFRMEGVVPITVDVQNTFWLKLYPQDLAEVYHTPEAYLRFHLQKRIEAFRRLPDDTPLDRVIPIYLCTPFETSFFGMPPRFYPDRDPIIDMTPVVRSPEDLHRLDPVDFHRAGLMPVAHRLYEGVGAQVTGAFRVIFAEWIRSPFSVALYLRGYEDMLLDLAADPDFAYTVIERVTEARKAWFRARAGYLGEPVPPGSLYNDEVDAAVISPAHYRRTILPLEESIGRFHGRISYWHSCGNSGPMARDIVGLGLVDLLDVSGWTDLAEVLSTVDRAMLPRLEVRLHPIKDVQQASPEWMAERVRRVVELCRQYDVPALTIRVSGFQPWSDDVESDLAHVRRWIGIAREAAAA